MKPNDIKPGLTYWDGKQGLREVISKDGSPIEVRFRLIAAKIERHFQGPVVGKAESLLGKESHVQLESFAKWAVSGHEPAEAQMILNTIHARRLKLSPGEQAYIDSVLKEVPGDTFTGMTISYDHTEGRAVGGLEKKGVLQRTKGFGEGEVQFSELGCALLLDTRKTRLAQRAVESETESLTGDDGQDESSASLPRPRMQA